MTIFRSVKATNCSNRQLGLNSYNLPVRSHHFESIKILPENTKLLIFSNKNKISIWNGKKIRNQWMFALWLSMDDCARIWNLNKEQTLLNMNGEFLFPKSYFIVTAINEKRMFERNKNVYGGKKYLRCEFPSSITHTSLTLQIKGMN